MNGIICIIVTTLVFIEGNALLKDDWKLFTEVHGKTYQDPVEQNFRMKIFKANNEMIEKHNLDYENGRVSYKLKMNRFGDLLPNEFSLMMNGYRKNLTRKVAPSRKFTVPANNGDLPDSMDWRKNGAVTPVKDQKQCGSCWAFSTTGALEGQHFRKTGKLLSLSEQNLVDCSGSYGNQGCGGGDQDLAFQYISDNHGIDSEASYPYEAKNNECRYDPNHAISSDKGYVDLPVGDESALKAAVVTIGPISVSIDATSDRFHFYSEGVYKESDCSTTELDHAVLVVGYDTAENGDEYWLVKNSWGSDWGDNGYVKMAKNRNNHCGIATSATYPLV